MPTFKNRRAAVASLTTVLGVTAWGPPVITSILLPAHAQTSVASQLDLYRSLSREQLLGDGSTISVLAELRLIDCSGRGVASCDVIVELDDGTSVSFSATNPDGTSGSIIILVPSDLVAPTSEISTISVTCEVGGVFESIVVSGTGLETLLDESIIRDPECT